MGGATPISAFWQEQPDEGQPASERTEVRVMFTADTLYIGVILFDREPDGIIVSDARRDAPMDDTDSFQMIVDTYRDRQNGFVFGTNPAGIEYDGQVTNEGQGGGGLGFGQMQAGGSGARLQHQLGRRLDGARQDHRAGLDRGVCHSVPHAALSLGDRSDLGHQLPAQHPPPQRARVLGADSAPVQSLSRVAGRFARRRADAGAAQPSRHAVRPGQRARLRRDAGRHRSCSATSAAT